MKSQVHISPAGKRTIIVVATILTIVVCFLLVGVFHLGDEAAVGVFAPDGSLAGFAVLVNGRVSSRNLASDAGEQPGDVLTFDVVVTDPKWRGFGIQKHLTDCAVSLARSSGRKLILATVSPGNSFSLNNFLSKGFSVSKEGLRKYDSLERSLLRLDL